MNVKKLIAMAAVVFSVGMMYAQSCDGLRIHYLGANHSLIRVEQPQKYLLLPVEEAAPEATVNVLVNNKVEKSFQVRLAVNKMDYAVPFDLTPYQGEAVTMDVHTGNSRSNVRDAMEEDGDYYVAVTPAPEVEAPYTYTSISVYTDKGRCKVKQLTIYPIQVK